jgi:hypothetical protein
MKKLIFTTLSLVAVGSAFAQQRIDNRNELKFKASNDVVTPAQQSKGMSKSVVADWYSPIDWVEGVGATLTTYVQFVMPDSLCKYIDADDTIRRPYNISFGQILDPKDDNIDLGTNPAIKLTKYTGYTLDSITLVYLYVRNVDQKDDGSGNMVDVVDTMVVNYFTVPNSGITKNSLVGSGEVVAYPSWSVANLAPTKFIASQKIALTRDDSTSSNNNNGGFENSWGLAVKTWAPPAPVNVAAGGAVDNIIGYTIGFKLGHAYDTNSVMIYQKDPVAHPLTNPRANYFGYRVSINEAGTDQQVNQTKFYTNSLMCTKTSAYNTASGSWTGYIPGNAYFESQYVNADAFLTAGNVGIKTINNDVFAMSNVYPNPAQVNGTAVMAFNLKAAGNVNVSIYNIAGQLVQNSISKNFTAGEHAEEISLAGLKAGIYMVNMTVNGATVTKKLTITE